MAEGHEFILQVASHDIYTYCPLLLLFFFFTFFSRGGVFFFLFFFSFFYFSFFFPKPGSLCLNISLALRGMVWCGSFRMFFFSYFLSTVVFSI